MAAATILPAGGAWAQNGTAFLRNTFGEIGLIEMPSARMAPDGELSTGVFFTENTQRYNFGFQALPWLHVGFRYSGLEDLHPPIPVYWDRSFSLKARLWDETDVFPAVAVGFNDLIGTGIYGGEYVVATKRIGAVEATLGMGWGRLGSTNLLRNPFTLLKSSFAERAPPFTVQAAGATSFSTLFHGPKVGLFGGVTWSTPVEGLTLSAEYSSDAYALERSVGTFKPRNQINLGAAYQFSDAATLSVSWLYGRTIGASLSFALAPSRDAFTQRIGTPPAEPVLRTPEEQNGSLQTLLHQRSSAAAEAQRARQADAQLVDRLWQIQGLSDVSLNGNTIALTLAVGDPATACRNAALLILPYRMAISDIRVTRGTAIAQCPVTRDGAPASSPLLLAASTSPAGRALAAPVMTIDAVGRSRSGDLAAIAKIRAEAERQQIMISALQITDSEAVVYYTNTVYRTEIEVIERLTRLLMRDAPPEVESFRLILMLDGQASREFDVLRAPVERSMAQFADIGLAENLQMMPAPMANPVLSMASRGTYPKFNWSIYPQFRQALFDPDNPFGVQVLAALDASVELLPGLTVAGAVEASMFDTFATNRVSDSLLPHVRSDFLTYFTKGKNGIAYLDAEYRFRLAPTVYAALRGGYLESMYAGVGGEVLWRPEGQRWALGLDLYEVQQRNFDRLLGLQNYRTFTGHVSLYYASPWYGLNFVARAGQYLAGDRGLTLEVTRRFRTGVEIGAFFTTTNVSAKQFGEGSFDKGIMIRIPIGWMIPINTQTQFNMDLRPVQRDGGQRLFGDTTLYEDTRRGSFEEVWTTLGR
jgi:hypothetical protein